MAPAEKTEEKTVQLQTSIEATKAALKEEVKSNEASENNGEYIRQPLKLAGVLDKYESFDVTPIIGKEFVNAQLSEWLAAENSDELIRDLAITGELTDLEEEAISFAHF
jgi:hypothetical protein